MLRPAPGVAATRTEGRDPPAKSALWRQHPPQLARLIKSRRPTIAPVEVAPRSCSPRLLHHVAMKTKRKLYGDPWRERFKNDDEANALLSRPQRWPYGIG